MRLCRATGLGACTVRFDQALEGVGGARWNARAVALPDLRRLRCRRRGVVALALTARALLLGLLLLGQLSLAFRE
jgi:hypothetical protein